MIEVLDFVMTTAEYDFYVARFTTEWDSLDEFFREDYEGLEDYIDSRFYEILYED